jgi:cobyrinic acid a,c-diamide synthase
MHRRKSVTNSITRSLVIAGLSGGSGKSVVTVGLTAALQQQGSKVVPFKKGPDYIDAGWLSAAAGRPCYNLDPYLMNEQSIVDSFATHCVDADFAIVEGNRGVYDGVNAEGGFSTAELAITLDLPVLLVVNCTKATRTIAALVLGCKNLDPRMQICGVILNQIATARHERIITEAVEKYTDIPVVGIVPRLGSDIFPMRHLGVTPHQEYGEAEKAVSQLAAMAEKHFDIEQIISLMQPCLRRKHVTCKLVTKKLKIGILRDAAFQFYYEENLDALRRGGAELVMINAISSQFLPDNLDALYIGGGFPETSAGALAENVSFRRSVREQTEKGLPIYAECGGLIFLGKSIVLQGQEYPLAGVFPVSFGMAVKPQAHGYSIFTVEHNNPFYAVGTIVKGHEFRYSTVETWDGKSKDLVLSMNRGTGFVEHRDGLSKNNVLALYTHVIASGTPEWAEGILAAASKFKQKKLKKTNQENL